MANAPMTPRKTLEEYFALQYPFHMLADPDGGYVIVFPDLPGCMTQVDSLDEVGRAAEEIRTLWIETAYEQGRDIPLPSYPEKYSGKFNVRLPRSLHRQLAEAAEREGISLNQYVVMLLSRGLEQDQAGQRVARKWVGSRLRSQHSSAAASPRELGKKEPRPLDKPPRRAGAD